MSEEKGLYSKYEVYRDGEEVTGVFVLDPESDPAARKAIEVYAGFTDDQELAADLLEWLDSGKERFDTITEQIAGHLKGVSGVYLVGSIARGDYTPESDIDLYVEEGEIGIDRMTFDGVEREVDEFHTIEEDDIFDPYPEAVRLDEKNEDIEQHWICEDCGIVIYVVSHIPDEPRYVACPSCGEPTEQR